jgi:hypothetical protein
MVVNELKKFENKTIDDLKLIREEMKEICEYNKNHYIKLFNQKYDVGVNLELSNIFDEIWQNLKKEQ